MLTEEDWYLIGLFNRVADQYINHAPMGVEKGAPPAITLRVEAIETALRVHRYPLTMWSWLTEGVSVLFRLFHGIDSIQWKRETGKEYRDIRPEDVADAAD